MRRSASAALLGALLLAGCARPGPEATLEVTAFSLQPLPAENKTLVEATVRLHTTGPDRAAPGVNFWVKDAGRGVLLSAHQAQVDLSATRPAELSFAVVASGLGFPVQFVAHGPDLEAAAWPPVADNTHPLATRLATGDATWTFPGTFATDRQVHHFVVDNTDLGTAAAGPVRGTLTVRMGTQDRLSLPVEVALGQYAEGGVLVRNGEGLEVTWRGAPADVLVFVGDAVFAEYVRVVPSTTASS